MKFHVLLNLTSILEGKFKVICMLIIWLWVLLKIYTSALALAKAASSCWLFGTALQETGGTIAWKNLVLCAKCKSAVIEAKINS